MASRSENIDTTKNCLMLLSRVGEGNGGEERRIFRCKTCFKEFSSFQALGGHRASHKKDRNDNDDQSNTKPKTTTHSCPICGLEFPIGQALGGHMTKHRNQNYSGALVTRSLFPEEPTMTTFKKSRVASCLDSM